MMKGWTRADFIAAICFVLAVWGMAAFLVWIARSEPDPLQQHRVRNEMYHQLLCERQDGLAKREGITLQSCPPSPDADH